VKRKGIKGEKRKGVGRGGKKKGEGGWKGWKGRGGRKGATEGRKGREGVGYLIECVGRGKGARGVMGSARN